MLLLINFLLRLPFIKSNILDATVKLRYLSNTLLNSSTLILTGSTMNSGRL